MARQGGVQIDYGLEFILLRGGEDQRAHFLRDHLIADGPGLLGGRNRRAEIDLRLRRQGLERVDHLLQVLGEIRLVRPVGRLGIIGPELDHHHVRIEREGILPGQLLHIRTVSRIHQRPGADPVVAHIILVPEHPLHQRGIAVRRAHIDAVAVGDAVADASHADRIHGGGLQIVQPGGQVGDHLVVVGEEGHEAEAVAARGIDVQRAAVAGVAHRGVVGDGVGHRRHELVVAGEQQDGGRGDVAAHLALVAVEGDQRRVGPLLTQQALERALVRPAAHRDHGIDEDLEIRTQFVGAVRGDRGSQVAAGRRAHDPDVARVEMPDGGAVAHRAHRILDIRDREGPVAVRDAIVDQGEGDALVVEERGPGRAFVGIGQDGIAAAGAAHHPASGRVVRQPDHHLGGPVGSQVQGQLADGASQNGHAAQSDQQQRNDNLFHILEFRNISFPGGPVQ